MNRGLRERAAYALATVCGTGYLPFAPGTWGSLAGLVLCALVHRHPFLHLGLFAILFSAGVISSGIVERLEGGKDPSHVVIDEFACVFVVYFLVPFTLPYIVAGFVLYRLFDILKPPPARQVERLPGGWGIMLDDLFAALYANLFLQLIRLSGLF
jgi:phosphatidylglycerophosphatase A